MPRYCAFFGSINVGGNRLTMTELRSAFAAEGFENVETIVASGNVLFDFDARPTPGLEEKLGIMMSEKFAMKSIVAVRDRDEIAAAISDNPYAANGDPSRVHTMFLDGQGDPDQFNVLLADHADHGREKMSLGDRALYINFVEGVAGSKLSATWLERRLGLRGTARNIRSLTRILAKLDEVAA